MDELITTQLTDLETGNEYLAHTVDIDGEFLTVLMLENKIIGIFKHIAVHDRFYCDSLYGDFDTNAEFAERIDTILMEQAEQES
jgi:hypothetical protein